MSRAREAFPVRGRRARRASEVQGGSRLRAETGGGTVWLAVLSPRLHV